MRRAVSVYVCNLGLRMIAIGLCRVFLQRDTTSQKGFVFLFMLCGLQDEILVSVFDFSLSVLLKGKMRSRPRHLD